MMFVLVKHIREFPFETIYSVNGQECGIAVFRRKKKQTTSDDPWCEANALDCFLIFWSPFVSRQKVKSHATQLGKIDLIQTVVNGSDRSPLPPATTPSGNELYSSLRFKVLALLAMYLLNRHIRLNVIIK